MSHEAVVEAQQPLMTHQKSTVVSQPGKGAFHTPPVLVCRKVRLASASRSAVAAGGDTGTDAPATELLAQGIAVVAPICRRVPSKMMEESSVSDRAVVRGEAEQLLTEREEELLRLVGQGMANKRIASHLSMSESTVKHHLRNVLDKLHLEKRAKAVAYAARRGIGSKSL